jgi:hypothetical protein
MSGMGSTVVWHEIALAAQPREAAMTWDVVGSVVGLAFVAVLCGAMLAMFVVAVIRPFPAAGSATGRSGPDGSMDSRTTASKDCSAGGSRDVVVPDGIAEHLRRDARLATDSSRSVRYEKGRYQMSGTVFAGGISAGGATYEVGVSDDQKAFTFTFSDMQLEVGNAADDVTTMLARVVWLVMPLEGGEADVEISLGLSGFAATGDRALGVLGWRLGGCDGEARFRPGSDGEFVEKITYTTTGAEAEVHLALWVTVERDGTDAGASLLTLTAIDGNIPI